MGHAITKSVPTYICIENDIFFQRQASNLSESIARETIAHIDLHDE